MQAREQPIDSLQQLLKKELTDAERINVLLSLITELNGAEFDLAIRYASEATSLCRETNNDHMLGMVFAREASTYRRNNDYEKCALYADSAILIGGRIGDKEVMAHGYLQKGFYYDAGDDRENAVNSFLKTLEIAPQGVVPQTEALAAIQLVGIFSTSMDAEMARRYITIAKERALLAKRDDLYVISGNLLAVYYTDLFKEDTTQVAFLDSALNIYTTIIAEYGAPGKITTDFSTVINMSLVNLMELYYDYMFERKEELDALLLKTEDLYREFPGSKLRSYTTYCKVKGLCLIRDGKLEEAEAVLLSGLKNLDELDFDDPYQRAELYKPLANIYELRGDYRKSLQYYKLYFSDSFSYSSSERLAAIRTIEAKYNTKIKEQQIEELKRQSYTRKVIVIFSIALAILSIVALVIVFKYYQSQRKLFVENDRRMRSERLEAETKLKLVEVELELQKNESLLKAARQEEAMVRLLAEKHLTVKQKEQLHKELLAMRLQIDKKDEILKEVSLTLQSQETRTNPEIQKIGKLIHQSIEINEEFEKAIADFKNVHPEFFTRVQIKADGKLTNLELRYCAYIHLQLPVKDIATMLNVTPETVRTAKYRIKQKLSLGQNENLDDFLKAKTASDSLSF